MMGQHGCQLLKVQHLMRAEAQWKQRDVQSWYLLRGDLRRMDFCETWMDLNYLNSWKSNISPESTELKVPESSAFCSSIPL